MPSKLLTRLIQDAILPAILLLGGKVIGVLVLSQAFSVAWKMDSHALVPAFVFDEPSVSLFINSYSNLLMYVVVVIGLAWVITKAYHFHDSHVSPSFVLRLLSWNLTGLLGNSREIYQKGIVWISYLWLVTVLLGVHFYLGLMYQWIFYFALASSVVATWYFVADVERELSHHEKHN